MQHRSSSLYENCRVLNHQGEWIFCCGKRKLNWYLKRNLAKVVSNNPITIQLSFIPKGDGHKNDPFFLQNRQNICVVCGSKEKLTRHHVVPHCYRRHCEEWVKSKNHFDILLVCSACHDVYEGFAYQFKSALADEYNAPIEGTPDNPPHYKEWCKIKSDAFALKHYVANIPKNKRNFLENRLINELKKINANATVDEILAMELQNKVITHGKIVIDQVKDLNAFFVLWRKHFLETMQPKFLPEHWNIERGVR